jgi:hypothetical protein
MFMMMDDIGALIWLFGKRFLTSSVDGSEQAPALHHAGERKPTVISPSPAAE